MTFLGRHRICHGSVVIILFTWALFGVKCNIEIHLNHNLAYFRRNLIFFLVKILNLGWLTNRAIYGMISSQYNSKMNPCLQCLPCWLTHLEYTICKIETTIFKTGPKESLVYTWYISQILKFLKPERINRKNKAVSALQKYWILPSITDNLYNILKSNFMCQMGLEKKGGDTFMWSAKLNEKN